MSKHRNWCFTLNNPSGPTTPDGLPEGATYIIFQHEIGESGTPHLQGYIEYKDPKTLRWVKDHFMNSAHLEPRMGTQAQAIAYCSKLDSRADPDAAPTEFGVKKTQGARSDLAIVAAKVADIDQPFEEVVQDHPVEFIKYHKGMLALRNFSLPRPPIRNTKDVIVYWGDPGAGKSKTACEDYPDAFLKSCNDKWWDGWDGEDTVILDEFPGTFTAAEAKVMLGEVNIPKETKGSKVNPHIKTYVITSNYEPDEWFSKAKAVDKAAVKRRLTRVVHFEYDGEGGPRTQTQTFPEQENSA